ncbi:MAG: ribosome maturation factor RimM [Bacteroidetes bacterium]|nr:ribosome maturation factor RimM [Bacteroidota bacterium]
MNEFYLIAKVSSVYGKEGFVKILSYTDFPERFFNLKVVYLDFFDDKKEFFVEEIKKQKNSFLLKFKNFDTASEAEILIDKEIFVDKQNLVKLPKNYFFVHDLIGSKVLRNNVELGVIKDVLKYPANDVYVVDNLGKEILIPAAFEFIESFDPENKILVLKPGDALYDDED